MLSAIALAMMLAAILGSLLIFVMLLPLGNLIQIPGWVFLAAAVSLGKLWGGVAWINGAMLCISPKGTQVA